VDLQKHCFFFAFPGDYYISKDKLEKRLKLKVILISMFRFGCVAVAPFGFLVLECLTFTEVTLAPPAIRELSPTSSEVNQQHSEITSKLFKAFDSSMLTDGCFLFCRNINGSIISFSIERIWYLKSTHIRTI